MDDKMIPFMAFESVTSRQERTIKRLWVLNILLVILLVATNACWLWYESQFDYYTITQEATATENSDVCLQSIGGNYYGRQSETND